MDIDGELFAARVVQARQMLSARIGREFRQVDLGRAIGKGRTTIVNYEGGSVPPPHTRQQLAKALGVSLAWLEGRASEPGASNVAESLPEYGWGNREDGSIIAFGPEIARRERNEAAAGSIPHHLRILAAEFKLEALRLNADEQFMRYAEGRLRDPELFEMYAGGHDVRPLTTAEQIADYTEVIEDLRRILKKRLKRFQAMSGKLAP